METRRSESKKAGAEERRAESPKNEKGWRNVKFLSFVFALVSGIAAIAGGLTALVGNWSVVTFDQGALNSLLQNTSNATLQSYLSILSQGAVSLQEALLLLVPLMVIAGTFMIISAFYLRSKNRERVRIGMIFTVIFSMFVFIGILVYLPFNTLAVAILFSYLGFNNTTVSASSIAVYALFLAYIILGILSPIVRLTEKE